MRAPPIGSSMVAGTGRRAPAVRNVACSPRRGGARFCHLVVRFRQGRTAGAMPPTILPSTTSGTPPPYRHRAFEAEDRRKALNGVLEGLARTAEWCPSTLPPRDIPDVSDAHSWRIPYTARTY